MSEQAVLATSVKYYNKQKAHSYITTWEENKEEFVINNVIFIEDDSSDEKGTFIVNK